MDTKTTALPLRLALFIDRDGTIIREPEDEQIDSLEKLEFVPGAITALRDIARLGKYELVMVSNQDGLGTKSFPEEDFWPAQNKMLKTLKGEGVEFSDILIDRTFPADGAPTRKPGTALLGHYTSGDYDLENCFVIGDRESDVLLSRNLGAKAVCLTDDPNMPSRLEASGAKAELITNSWEEISRLIHSSARSAERWRKTRETDIHIALDLDGKGETRINTGLHFFDHMLSQLPSHALISLIAECKGDLEVDEHHTMEDVAIALGETLLEALGDKRGIERYGFVLPMDECEALVLLDLGGRADFVWDVPFTREYVGDTPTEMFQHFFKSLCVALRCNLHIVAKGENNHHLAESVFKGFAHALKCAIRRDVFSYQLPSSKGVL